VGVRLSNIPEAEDAARALLREGYREVEIVDNTSGNVVKLVR
jgi:hypothetical protein